MKPWEETGKKITLSDSLAEAMTEANVMFNVSVRQGFFKDGDLLVKAESFFYITRDDLNIALGQCKGRFQPLQNADAFAFFDPLIRNGDLKIDTIGCMGKGQKVWILAEIVNRKYKIVTGDDISLYLLLINSHDGSTMVTIGVVPIRIVCSNMFSMLSKSEHKIIKFKHTGEPAEKLKLTIEFINDQLGDIDKFIYKLIYLTKKWPSPEKLDTYYRTIFNIDKDNASTKAENKIKRLKELFIHGQGNQSEKVRGTWYAAYNSVSEYLNYEAGRSPETRLNSLWFGANNKFNILALELAFKEVS